jgi:perosamine synthetase
MNFQKILLELKSKIHKVCGNKKLPLHEPFFFGNETKEIRKCIRSTFVSTKSEVIKTFEKKISEYTSSKYVIALSSGTAALHMSLLAIDVKKNEEILLPSFNFVAAANAILYCDAVPHFVDIEEDTLSIDPYKLENYLKKKFFIKNNTCYNLKTNRAIKAIIVPHIFGIPAKIIEIKKIAKKYFIKVIEDAAESLGSFYCNKHTGTFGDLGILSFNGNKIMTTGGGGAILTNNKSLEKKIRHLIELSKIKHPWKFSYTQLGYNLKMPGINAALGCAQIDYIKRLIFMKKKIYFRYKRQFENSHFFTLMQEPSGCKSNFWLNNIKIKCESSLLKNYLIKNLNANGIQLRPAWSLLHKASYLKKFPRDNLKTSNILFNKIISLPSSAALFYKNA